MTPAPKITLRRCPLTPALLALLQASVDAPSLHDRTLAQRLPLSPETVRTEFKRISQILGTHDCFASITMAWEHGWITLPLRR